MLTFPKNRQSLIVSKQTTDHDSDEMGRQEVSDKIGVKVSIIDFQEWWIVLLLNLEGFN